MGIHTGAMQSLPCDLQQRIASVLCATLAIDALPTAICLLSALRCAVRGVLFEKVRDGVLKNWRAQLRRDAPWLLTAYFHVFKDPLDFTVPFRALDTAAAHEIYTAFKALWAARELHVLDGGDAANDVVRRKMADPTSALRRAWQFPCLGNERNKWHVYVALSCQASCPTTIASAVAGTFVRTQAMGYPSSVSVGSDMPSFLDAPRPSHYLTTWVRVAATTQEDMNNILDPLAEEHRPLCYASVYARRDATLATPPHCVPLLRNEPMYVFHVDSEAHKLSPHPDGRDSIVRRLVTQRKYIRTEGCATWDEVHAGTHVGPDTSIRGSVKLGLVVTTTQQPDGSLVTVVDRVLDNGETSITASIYYVPGHK